MSVIDGLSYSPDVNKLLVAPLRYWKAFHLTVSFDLSHTVSLGVKFFQSNSFLAKSESLLQSFICFSACSAKACGASGVGVEK